LGIIQKQSISGTIYSYIGVALGFITVGILYPRIFSTEEVGLLRILVSYSTLFAQFASLGINTATIKLFPFFRNNEKKHHGYLGMALIVSLVGLMIVIPAYLMLRPYFLEHGEEKSALFVNYFYYVVPLIIFTLLFNLLDTYYRVLYNAVKGIVYKEVVQRVLILLVIVAYFLNIISFNLTVILYVVALVTPTFFLIFSVVKSGQFFLKPDFSSIDKTLRKQLIDVSFFGMVTTFSGMLVLNIDVIMVERFMGLSAAGIYTVTFFFGTLILVPLRTMGKIGSVVISDAWKANDLDTINNIYKKSSISLSVLGFLLFIGIWGNIDNIFFIIKDAYLPGKFVILFIGLANLTDIALGVNPQIITNSKYYRYISYFLFIFAILLIATNLLLIPILGIVGAALASLISKFIFNFIKFLFLYKKFHFQPFNYKFILLIIISLSAYAVSLLIPQLPNYIIDIIVRSAVISIVFLIPVYFLKISDDINRKINETISSLLNRTKSN
jgi:O-antigen/teichoic acid export membrane protein